MTDIEETARAELIQRLRKAGGIEKLHEAARIERAETIHKLLRKLLHRERRDLASPMPCQPATGDCR
jgi:hypothetical protein